MTQLSQLAGMRTWADVPEAERMNERLVRRWAALMIQQYGSTSTDRWIQEALHKQAAARCHAAVRWFDLIDGVQYWRRCEMPLKAGEQWCRIHREYRVPTQTSPEQEPAA